MAKADEKPEESGPLMEPGEVKRLLGQARSKPVNVAVGQGASKTGGLGMLLLDRVQPGKSLLKELKEKDPGVSKLCFGTASVGGGTDPKLVTLTLNRRPSGLERKLRLALKGTGYKKLAIEIKKE